MGTSRATGKAIRVAFAAFCIVTAARAAVSPEQAAALDTTLTAFGAERAGSADGSIPPYTGGMPSLRSSGAQAGVIGAGFANEQPTLIIAAHNMEASRAHLTEGTIELLRRYPTFCVDVFPTHRSVAYPAWLSENTRHNATSARTTNSGLGLQDALPGVPFPIPADGSEVMWNHRLRYMGTAFGFRFESWLVPPSTSPVLAGAGMSSWEFPVFDRKHKRPIRPDDRLYLWRGDLTAPQRRAGETTLLIDAVDPLQKPREVWVYIPGQRRARLVNMPLDAPSSQSSGTTITDDSFVFTGSLERFDVKLLGKREMYVPYNAYRFSFEGDAATVLRPNHVNPEAMRWELHRVWVVEATLKPGQHHPYGRRVFYVDEDSWTGLASDEYDADGKLLRAVFAPLTADAETGEPFTPNYLAYDFSNGTYYVAYRPGPNSGFRRGVVFPESTWSPEAMAGSGVR